MRVWCPLYFIIYLVFESLASSWRVLLVGILLYFRVQTFLKHNIAFHINCHSLRHKGRTETLIGGKETVPDARSRGIPGAPWGPSWALGGLRGPLGAFVDPKCHLMFVQIDVISRSPQKQIY